MCIRAASRSAVWALAMLACGSPLAAQAPEVDLDPEFPLALESTVRVAPRLRARA